MVNQKEDADESQSRTKIIGEDNMKSGKDQLRRRAQNRASQRAYRERQRRHAESLREQVCEMQKVHDELFRSYSQKEEEVSELHEKIHDLEHEIRMLNASSPASLSSQTSASIQLEPVVFDDSCERWPAADFQIPISCDGRVQPMDDVFGFPPLAGCF